MDARQKESPGQDKESLRLTDASFLSSAGSQKTDEALTLDTDAALQPRSRNESAGTAVMRPGAVLGTRYEILRQLGKGGMGAVYKAKDRELDRVVALKVIRPELADQPESLQRFKQELILARQVTHKNVIRIFDLGEADGIKFITMECVEGQDLRSLLKQKGKFTAQESTAIIVQVCRALEAAHAEGVVHRDLKPQNIIIDAQGKATVMDFGIAHSAEFTGMTQAGALLGTLEYMSPEQAKGQKADERSDLFALGIILYELLTGQTPYKADTALATLLRRTQERALPPTEFDATIPRYLSDVVMKCLEIDPRLRYQSASEVLADLQTGHGPRTALRLSLPRFRMVEEHPTRWVALALVTILLLIALAVFRLTVFRTAVRPTVSLAIIPFRNASGDLSLDWVGTYVSETLGTEVGQSSSLRIVSPDRVQQTLHDLQLTPNSSLDFATARRLAESSGAQTVIWGQYLKFGEQIRIDATLQDLKNGRIVPLKVEARSQEALPATVDRLAQAARENFSLSSSSLKELQAQSFRPSSKSMLALRDYNRGLELARGRKDLEARKLLEAATQEDPGFALAYSKLSEVYSLLGYHNEAEQSSDKAVELSANLPVPEKYRIAASHLWIQRDYPKAVDAYENLAKASPNDVDVQSALGILYRDSGAYDKARAQYAQLLEGNPKSGDALYEMAQVEVLTGNPRTAIDYLNSALTIAIKLENDEEKALILHTTGAAYRRLNKPDEAMRNLQESLTITRRLGEKAAMARTLNEMGQLLYGVGKSDDALKNYEDALKLRRDIGDKKGLGDTLIDLGNLYQERGDSSQALQRYQESLQIQRDLSDEFSQAICLNNMGSAYFTRGDYQEALTFFQQALQLREKLKVPTEIAETVHNLGDTSLRKGEFDQALFQYLRAIELYRGTGSSRDVAIESHSTAMVFEFQGRYGAALNAEEEALKVFRGLQGSGFWLGDALSGYGHALSLVGRDEQAQKNLDEALNLARQIKSGPLIAQTLNYQGDRLFYKGDLQSARSQYKEALQTASHTSDREKVLVSKINVAKIAVKEGRHREATNELRALGQLSDGLGLKYLSVDCSIYLAEAMIASEDYTVARKQLEKELRNSEKLGSRMQTVRIHYQLGTALRLSGNASEAAAHYATTLRLLADIQKEAGAERITERPDVRLMYAECVRRAQIEKP